MAQQIVKQTFRKTFKTIDKDLVRWFPGHMDKGLKQMQQKLKLVDCIIEVHDARIPFSGRNTDFKYTVSGLKPHILILNKKDLIEHKVISSIEKKLKNEYSNIIFTNCKNDQDKSIRKVLPLAEKLIASSERFNRLHSTEINLMVIGVPNVGKSSVINSMRNFHIKRPNAAAVGAVPGITRSVMNRIKISEEPLVYLFDTPGILTPSVQNTEVGLKLALCATIKDSVVGETIIADYLLFYLNKHEIFTYVKYFGLEKPVDNILEVLLAIAHKLNKTLKLRSSDGWVVKPDLFYAAQYMIKCFRNGELGKIMLDQEFIL